ncbi:MAG: hypothetical protein RIR34_989 [Actinomycetota bacterium]
MTLGALIGGAGSASAAAGDAFQNEYSSVNGDSQIMAVISDKAGNDFTGFGRIIPTEKQASNREGLHWCMSTKDPQCDYTVPGDTYAGQVVLEDCSLTTSPYCVEKLSLAGNGKDFDAAKFVRPSKQQQFEADPAINFPSGGSTGLYTSDSAPTSGGLNSYAVTVVLKLSWDENTRKFVPSGLMANVYPYREQPDSRLRGIAGSGDSIGAGCIFVEPGKCGILQDWKTGTRAKLSVRVPSVVGGWFKGRITNPEISVEPVDASVNRITVAADPVTVPQLGVVMPKSEKDELLNSNLNLGWWGGPGFVEVGTEAGGNTVSQFIERYRALTKDSASGATTMWNFASVNAGNGSGCLSDVSKVQGIVTTNAMGYDGSAPSYENGMLTYHVSGMHYLADGTTLAEGTYDLIMRSDTARCLYGFSKAPIQAVISVIDDKGEAKTAVATVNEADGWLTMRAYGFTFSNPVVKVKLSQAKELGGVEANGKAKKVITCVKGKLTKKVSGTAPKCPAGYKKKS